MNLPNKLTLLRIILVPVLVLVWIFPYAQFGIYMPILQIGGVTGVSLSVTNLIVLAIFAFASITDFVDGFIARKYNLVTTFGKFADPLADKCLVLSAFLILMCQNQNAYFGDFALQLDAVLTSITIPKATTYI